MPGKNKNKQEDQDLHGRLSLGDLVKVAGELQSEKEKLLTLMNLLGILLDIKMLLICALELCL